MTANVERAALPNGNRKEISLLDLFDFVIGSHLAQQEDTIAMLIVPYGHLIQSQQHGAVISFWVPGEHFVEQKDTGLLRVFQSKLETFLPPASRKLFSGLPPLSPFSITNY